ncbi:MAG TPA: single-stranded-DNA-specific exonuclease RecJ [Terriglobia bacterium]|nr:single-stranded-DNA-specific exonuclease RecJ [Terriglobia bacterium]
MRWLLPQADPARAGAAARLTRELAIPPLVAGLLAARGLEDPAAADRFLHPRLDHLHDPFRMADMGKAVERLRRAVAAHEKILIYGDYDVDGTMSVVVLLTVLRSMGASVDTYVPHRLTDGYGMRVPVVERAAADGYRVVLSVDTGIREHEVIARARDLGVDCIVTDHHLPGPGGASRLPPACAILNPKRPDCAYPEKNLAGVGVAFKLAQALLREQGTGNREQAGAGPSPRLLESYLKIVAIGTIADVVPLVGENRVITRLGLASLSDPARRAHPGLRALLEVSGLGNRPVTAGDVGFRIAPRLNAAGRMEDARDVIELFTTPDAAKACAIAERLDRLNTERQQVEEHIVKEILARLEQEPERASRYFMVFAGEGWHRGVIGIVAQRVVERTNRPAVVIGVENGVGQGSGRSIRGFHLLDALASADRLLQRYGGHAQAAGFTLAADRIPELEAALESHARAVLSPEDLEPTQRVDARVSFADLNRDLYAALNLLEPYGFGNPTPVFVADGLRLVSPPRILKERHLKLRLAQYSGGSAASATRPAGAASAVGSNSFDALGWGLADQGPALAGLTEGHELAAAFTLDENVYQGLASLQLVLKDFRVQ